MPPRFLNQLNIRTRLLLLCFAVSMPLLVLSLISIAKEYQALKNEARRATTFQAAIAVRALSHWIQAQQDALKALAALPAVRRVDVESTKPVLTTACQAQAAWQGIILVDTGGAPLAASSGAHPLSKEALAAAEVFDKVVRTEGPAISGYLDAPLVSRPVLLAAQPIFDGGRLKAVLIAQIAPEAVLRLFSGTDADSGSVITVVDDKKTVVCRTLNNAQWAGKDFSRARTVAAASTAQSGTMEAVGIADPTLRTYAFDHVPGTAWLVVVGVPNSAIYGPAHDWLILMLLLVGCAVGLSVSLAYAVTGHFTGPISELVREAVAVGRGDLSKRVYIATGDEFGLLARAFNQMAANLEVTEEHKLMVEHICEAIRRSLDLDQILNTTVRELGQALSASRCCLALVDASAAEDLSGRRLVFDYTWWDEKRQGTPLRNRCIQITEDSVLKNILAQNTIASIDVIEAPDLAPLFENVEAYPEDWRSIKSMLACPIAAADQPIGIVLVHQCDKRRLFTDSELEMVEAVGTHVALAMEQARLFAQSKAHAEQERLINHIVRAVRGSLDLNTILSTVTKELGEALAADRCQILQPSPESPLAVSHEYTAPNLAGAVGLSLYELSEDRRGVAGQAVLGIDLSDLKTSAQAAAATVADAPVAVVGNALDDKRTAPFRSFLEALGSRSLIAAPLLDNNRLVGVLMVHQCFFERDWQPFEASLVAAIADQVSVAITHAQLFAQVRHQAITDGLTGLYNHIYLKKRLTEELRRAQRKGLSLALLMIDLDNLKTINDRHGHPVGDQAIRQVARTLKRVLRSGDTAARYGGEEFAVILPDTSLSAAALIAERLCRTVHQKAVTGLGQISVSIGAAVFPSQAASLEELLERADKALYKAKHSGRNQVCLWDGAGQALQSTRTGRS